MSDTKLLDQIKSERGFIHDLATPLMIAHGMVDAVCSKMEDGNEKERLLKANKALQKMTDILKARRETLINQTEEAKGSE